MKNRKGMFAFLLKIVNAGFWLSLLMLILSIVFDVFTSDGELGTFYVGNHHSQGYSIPVKTRISFPDSTLQYDLIQKEFGNQRYGGSLHFHNRHNEGNDSLMRVFESHGCTLQSVTRNQFSDTYFGPKNEVATFSFKPELESKGYLRANTSIWHLKMLLLINAYLGLTFSVLIFHHLGQLFDLLSRDLSFSKYIYERINKVGFLLLAYVVIQLLISYTLVRSCNNIWFSSFTDGRYTSLPFTLDVSPRLVFDFTWFILGLSLIGLTGLFKKGVSLQSENELTI
ncbi:MAG: DUF2975 domain-containing protein [Carboxylicivirga sp.]|jgi:hypothetical protein|nr:DUF2975 domain-containing protein [Carboxylicivirga sp.]